MSGMNGAIIGHSLVSFAGLQTQDRDDILDCLSQADGVASRAFKPGEDFTSWMFRYRNRLEKHGCVSITPIIHEPQVIFSAEELDHIAITLIDSASSLALGQQAAALLSAMRVHRFAEHFFDSGNREGDLVSFQLVPSMLDSQGQVTLLVCGIRLAGYVENRSFDFWSAQRREMVLRISGAAYRFDRDIYAGYRQAIRQELKAHATGELRRFNL